MSANLMWRPRAKSRGSLPDGLKFILRDKCGLTDDPRTFDNADIPYLTALTHANVEGAQELLDLIEKHEEVELWLEY